MSVIQSGDDGYKVIFEENGEQSGISGYGEGLTPVSTVVIQTVSSGSATTKAAFWITLRQIVVTEEVGDWSDEPICTAIVESIKPDIWDIYLTSQPQDGTFSVSVDGEEPFVMSVFDDAETVEQVIGEGYSVSKLGDFRWRVKSDSEDSFVLVVDEDDNIVSFNGKTNTILFNDQVISEMLSGNAMQSTTLEIAVTTDGKKNTLISAPCTVTAKTTS